MFYYYYYYYNDERELRSVGVVKGQYSATLLDLISDANTKWDFEADDRSTVTWKNLVK